MTRHDKSRAIARGTRGAATLAAMLVLVACGSKNDTSSSNPAPAAPATSDSTDTSTPSAEPSPDASASSTPGKATTVTATESEYSIKLSTSTFHAGSYTFAVTNSGSFKHALTLDGPGVMDKSTGDIAPGASGKVTVTLAKGTYDVYCPVGNHKSMGMDTKITVG